MNIKSAKKMMLCLGLGAVVATPAFLAVSCSSAENKNFIKLVEQSANGRNVMIKKSSISSYKKIGRPNDLEGFSWFSNDNTWIVKIENSEVPYIYNEAIIKLNDYIENNNPLAPTFALNLNNNWLDNDQKFDPSLASKRSDSSFLQALNPKNWMMQTSFNYKGIDLYTRIPREIPIKISDSVFGENGAPFVYVPIIISLKDSLKPNIQSQNKIWRLYWSVFSDFKSSSTPDDILDTMNDSNIRVRNYAVRPDYNNEYHNYEPTGNTSDELRSIFIEEITKHYPILNWNNRLLKSPKVKIQSWYWTNQIYPDGNNNPFYGYVVDYYILNEAGESSSTKSINIYDGGY